eukprot:Nk52_evm19s2152 gene=Nk52_evmTU19s2152
MEEKDQKRYENNNNNKKKKENQRVLRRSSSSSSATGGGAGTSSTSVGDQDFILSQRDRTQQGHLLLVSLLENFCVMYGTDGNKHRKLFFVICKQLARMGIIDSVSFLDDLGHVRNAYKRAFTGLITEAFKSIEREESYLKSRSLGYNDEKGERAEEGEEEGEEEGGREGKKKKKKKRGNSTNHNLHEHVPMSPPPPPPRPPVNHARGVEDAGKKMGGGGGGKEEVPVFASSRYLEDFEELGKLGDGGFGTVFKARNRLDGRVYAIKKVRLKNCDWSVYTKVMREVKSLAHLEHENVVRYHAAWVEYGSIGGGHGKSRGKNRNNNNNDDDNDVMGRNTNKHHVGHAAIAAEPAVGDDYLGPALRDMFGGLLGSANGAPASEATPAPFYHHYKLNNQGPGGTGSQNFPYRGQPRIEAPLGIGMAGARTIGGSTGKVGRRHSTNSRETEAYLSYFSGSSHSSTMELLHSSSGSSNIDSRNDGSDGLLFRPRGRIGGEEEDSVRDVTPVATCSDDLYEEDSIVFEDMHMQSSHHHLHSHVQFVDDDFELKQQREMWQGRARIRNFSEVSESSFLDFAVGSASSDLDELDNDSRGTGGHTKDDDSGSEIVFENENGGGLENSGDGMERRLSDDSNEDEFDPSKNQSLAVMVDRARRRYSSQSSAWSLASSSTSRNAFFAKHAGEIDDVIPRRKGSGDHKAHDFLGDFGEFSASGCLTLFIQMQYCQRMLRDWISERNQNMPTAEVEGANYEESMKIFHQIVKGVEYIHCEGLIHRDLKPVNIFMHGSVVKIGDFGLCTGTIEGCIPLAHPTKNYSEETFGQVRSLNAPTDEIADIHGSASSLVLLGTNLSDHTTGVGTGTYASPEQLLQRDGFEGYDEKTDIFSLGIIFFELFFPFKTGMERVIALKNLREGILPEEFLVRCPKESAFILWLTAADPKDRPSASEISQLALIKQGEDEQMKDLKRQLCEKDDEIAMLREELMKLKTASANFHGTTSDT